MNRYIHSYMKYKYTVAGMRSLHNTTRRALIEQGVNRLNPVWFARWEASHRDDVAKFEAAARSEEVAQ